MVNICVVVDIRPSLSARHVRVKKRGWEVGRYDLIKTLYQQESSSCYSHVLLVSRNERASHDSCFRSSS